MQHPRLRCTAESRLGAASKQVRSFRVFAWKRPPNQAQCDDASNMNEVDHVYAPCLYPLRRPKYQDTRIRRQNITNLISRYVGTFLISIT